jgi:hypothetical protein
LIDNLQRKVYNRRKPKQERIVRKNRLADLIGKLFPGIQGNNTPFIQDLGSMPDQVSLINALISVNPWPAIAFNTYAGTGAVTLSQQQTMAAEFTVLDITSLSAGAAITLPTVATLLATLTPQQGVIGSAVTLRVMNPSSFTATMTTNTGWTLNGTMTIPTLTFRDFIVQINSVTGATATLQDVGAGTAAAQ